MDINKLSNQNKLALCKKYFVVGFALLPFMWAINAVWFMQEAFFKSAYPEQKTMRKYVVLSGIGATVWLVGLVSWCVVFSQKRSDWGEFADNLSFIIPKGVP